MACSKRRLLVSSVHCSALHCIHNQNPMHSNLSSVFIHFMSLRHCTGTVVLCSASVASETRTSKRQVGARVCVTHLRASLPFFDFLWHMPSLLSRRLSLAPFLFQHNAIQTLSDKNSNLLQLSYSRAHLRRANI